MSEQNISVFQAVKLVKVQRSASEDKDYNNSLIVKREREQRKSGNESLSKRQRKKQAVKAGIKVGAEASQKRAIWSKKRKVAKKCKVFEHRLCLAGQ